MLLLLGQLLLVLLLLSRLLVLLLLLVFLSKVLLLMLLGVNTEVLLGSTVGRLLELIEEMLLLGIVFTLVSNTLVGIRGLLGGKGSKQT